MANHHFSGRNCSNGLTFLRKSLTFMDSNMQVQWNVCGI